MGTILSLMSLVSVTALIYLGYANWSATMKFDVPILNISGTYPVGYVIILIAVLGTIFGLCHSLSLYRSQKLKTEAYYRELERASINSMTGNDRVKVLEGKIQVLEKALEDALKKREG